MFSLSDPAGDDNGPGYYVYPKSPIYAPGSFDLVGVDVATSEGRVNFSVRFKNAFGSLPFLQNIEIYIDKDHRPGSGEAGLLPGRGANVARESFWEQAIFVTPRPLLAETELKRLAPALSGKVMIPKKYMISGNKVEFEVSPGALGYPDRVWGYIIIVTPAALDVEPKKISILSSSADVEPLLLKPVKEKPSEFYFGGGDASGVSPNIIDMIVPASPAGGPSGETQGKVLSSYNSITRTRVAIKAVYPLEEWVKVKEEKGAAEPFAVEATVLAMGADRKITIDKGERDGMYVGRIGSITDEYGDEITNVVVEKTYDTYSVCKIMKVAVLSYVGERMKVRFK